jgi:hypothetical protein
LQSSRKTSYNCSLENYYWNGHSFGPSVKRVNEVGVDRQVRLEALLRVRLHELDHNAEVRSAVRPDGKIDVTVVSRLFEGKDSRDREALFWPVFDPVPKSELIYLTYCLLLTPDEARRDFGEMLSEPGNRGENWDE